MPTSDETREYVSQHIFDEIFNHSCNTLRNNIKLAILNNGRIIRGSLYNNVVQLEFPDTHTFYYGYLCGSIELSGLLKDVTDWARLDQVVNDEDVSVSIFSGSHKIIPPASVYVKTTMCNQLAVIIPRRVMQLIDDSQDDVYITISSDTDGVDDRTMISHTPGVQDNLSNILTAINTIDHKYLFVTVNGYHYTPSQVSTLATSEDYVDMTIDYNIQFDFSVSLEDRNTYMSDEEQLYKDLIIIPRGYIDNRVWTYDTINIIVRDRFSGKGVMLPYTAEESVSQLSATVLSITSSIIDAALDVLGNGNHEMYIQVSDFNKTTELGEDGILSQYLYTQDDNFLEKTLLNQLSPQIPVWTASKLESSSYAKSLTSMLMYRGTHSETVQRQIETLGYYEYIRTICKHTGTINIDNSTLSELLIKKPHYWLDTDVQVRLFSDGYKIPASAFEIVDDTDGIITIQFSPVYNIVAGTDVMFTMMPADYPTVWRFIPTTSSRALYIPKDVPFKAFRKVMSNNQNHLGGYTNDAYEEINVDSNVYFDVSEPGDIRLLFFSTTSYDEEFIIQLTESSMFNLHTNVPRGSDSISFPLMMDISNDVGATANVLFDADYEVYMNNRYLIEGIDYHIIRVEDNDGFIKGYQMVIQNTKHILSVNDIEIYMVNQHIATEEIGYIVDRIIPITQHNEAWVDGLSNLYVDGRLIDPSLITRHDSHYEIDMNAFTSNGQVYRVVLPISRDVYNQHKSYDISQYLIDRSTISLYFMSLYEDLISQPIVVPAVHTIYSVYLNEIIKRILSGDPTVQYFNDDQSIIDQLSDEEWLKEYDLFFQTNKLDMDFIDIYPIIDTNLQVDDIEMYQFINRLVTIIIGNDHVTDGLVQYIRT